MVRTAAATAKLESTLLAAAGYLAGKRSQRDHLRVGSTPVSLQITGTVGRAQVAIAAAGVLEVAADQVSAGSAKPNVEHVLAYVLGRLPDAERSALLANMPRQFESKGKLPAVPKTRLAEVAGLLSRLRSSKPTKKRGAVVFVVDTGNETADGE